MNDSVKKKYALKKYEILRSKKVIQELFDNGSSFFLYPFKIFYIKQENNSHQAIFTVSIRNHRKAVDRNLIKRRLKEAYRLNKFILPEPKGFSVSFAIIYISKDKLHFDVIQDKLKLALWRLNKICATINQDRNEYEE